MSRITGGQKLIVFTAPSGSGKTTVVRHLLDRFGQLAFSVSATTRARRPHERHGHSYYFLSTETFQQWIDDDVFVEWEEVYHDQKYGTPAFEIERLWDFGKHVIFDIDVKGAVNIKKRYPGNTIVVFVKVPTIEMLIERLKARGTETEESLRKRIDRIRNELTYEQRFDVVLINDELEHTLAEAERIVSSLLTPNEMR
jgi:guanylate kinase